MTVREVIAQLSIMDMDADVYVLDMDRKAQICKEVCRLTHLNLPGGISIPDDVAILAQDTVESLDESEAEEVE